MYNNVLLLYYMTRKNICDKNLSFSDCELLILRMQVDQSKEKMARRIINTPEIQEIIEIVENFIKKKKLICYGGTALNNILPIEDQFYNKDTEIADYDFYSFDALNDAKELADIYFKKGYLEVEAKAGQHHGTYKVFVNFLGVADISNIPKGLFKSLKRDSLRVNGILYAPVNFLRMGVYLETSRPAGDVDRWEKIWGRLQLLNKHYPLTTINCNSKIESSEFQRDFDGKSVNPKDKDLIYDTVKETFINQGVVFFGGYAMSEYSKYMPKNAHDKIKKIADFDVISNDPDATSEIVKERLMDVGIKNIKIIEHEQIGEIIPMHYEVRIGKDETVAFIYKPIACHSYNLITINNKKIKIATIDTMLSFFLAFLYADKEYFDIERILCMSKFLYDVQQKNRLEQKGLLKRFSITCYGHQITLEEMRSNKAQKYKELKNKKGTKDYDEWFLNYKPGEKKNNNNDNITKKKKDIKNVTKKKKNIKKKSSKKSK